MQILDHTTCELGEGAFWHPERSAFFWFDILNRKLFWNDGTQTAMRDLPALFSAAGWIDRDTLVLSGEEGLFRYEINSGALSPIMFIEAENAVTRSNDGRTDPWGGFWASTMGRTAEAGAGSIYRYYRGQLQRLHGGISIPNAICFDAERELAYFADSARQVVWRQALDAETGWPCGEAEAFIDFNASDLVPDGAVTDAAGNVWIAHWGARMVGCYGPDGRAVSSVAVPASQVSCPAFGGADFRTLYVTSAREGMDAASLVADPHAGKTFFGPVEARGLPAPRFIV